jgi:hypothetical protein
MVEVEEGIEQEKWAEGLFKIIMIETSKYQREVNIKIHEIQMAPNRLNIKSFIESHYNQILKSQR